jgi:hypothetical protein
MSLGTRHSSRVLVPPIKLGIGFIGLLFLFPLTAESVDQKLLSPEIAPVLQQPSVPLPAKKPGSNSNINPAVSPNTKPPSSKTQGQVNPPQPKKPEARKVQPPPRQEPPSRANASKPDRPKAALSTPKRDDKISMPYQPEIKNQMDQFQDIKGDSSSDLEAQSDYLKDRELGALVLDTDLSNEDAEPNQIVVVTQASESIAELQQTLLQQGYRVLRSRVLPNLDQTITVFQTPSAKPLSGSLEEVEASSMGVVALNTRYRLLDQPGTTQYYASSLLNWREQNSNCKGKVKIAMIDTEIDVDHPALAKSQIKVHSVLDDSSIPANTDHGTAVASILVGSSTAVDHAGLLNGFNIIAVNVFRKREDGSDTNVELLSYAMDKLIGDRVAVVNLSFGGPSNKILQDLMNYAQNLGITVVAAAGNGGPVAPPVYPAAYNSTIAVTAVDGAKRIYPKSNQGSYITVAAPGVDIWLAKPGGGGRYLSGTSYAAPFVTAIYALIRSANPEESAGSSHERVKREAKDLGAPGYDPIYGYGLVQSPDLCAG